MVEKTTSYYSYELSNTFCGKTPSPKTELDVCLTFFHSTWFLPHQKKHITCAVSSHYLPLTSKEKLKEIFYNSST